MVRCAFCGSENEPEAAFCGTCGKALVAAPAGPPGGADDTVVPGRDGPGRRESAERPAPAPGPGADPAVPPPPAPPPPAAPDPGSIICTRCGTANEPTRVYCRKCANELRPPPPPPPPPPDERPRPRILPAAIALVAVVAVLAVSGLTYGLLSGRTTPASPSPSTIADISPSASTSPSASPSATPSSSPSPSEPSTPSGEIVFAGGRDNIDLYIVNADGSGEVRRLTTAAGTDDDPAFSPDGSQVAYADRTGLRVLDVESGESRRITAVAGDRNAFWSPVADVMLLSRGNRQTREIFRMDLGGLEAIQLTDNQIEDHDPVVSPDGTAVIWVVGEGDQRELWMMGLDGNVIDKLTDDNIDDVDPAYAPSGDRIVFASRRGPSGEPQDHSDLWILELANQMMTQLTDLEGDEHDPWWSPGGRFVAFHAGAQDGLPGAERNEDLYIVDTTTGAVFPLLQSPNREVTPTWRP